MRFAFLTYILFFLTLVPRPSFAQDIPVPMEGYSVRKVAQNLGRVKAIATHSQDIFILDGEKQEIIRLRDQNGNGDIDIRSVYLLGFDRPSDMVSLDGALFISDKNGVWQSTVGKTLSAAQAPVNITPNVSEIGFIPTALAGKGQTLYVSGKTQNAGGTIYSLDLETFQTRAIISGPWHVSALSISPNGDLWAALQMDGTGQIVRINANTDVDLQTSALKFSDTEINDIALWQSQFLIAKGGLKPILHQYNFAYGGLSETASPLIDGFSRPSVVLGKTDILGIPTAMSYTSNDKLIFADGKNGTLWQVSKTKLKPVKIAPIVQEQTVSKPEKIIQRPDVLKGSSIITASTLTHGSAIGKEELLKTDKLRKSSSQSSTPKPD